MAGRVYFPFALSVIALLILSGTAFAQNLTVNQTYLIAAAQFAQCKTNFTSAFVGQVTAAVPRLSGLGKFPTALQSETSQLASIAATGNVSAFRAYLSGTYDPELNLISTNVSAQLRNANLSRNQTLQLRQLYNGSFATYSACRINSVRNAALKKLSLFNGSIATYQNEAGTLSQQGLDVGTLTALLQSAKSQIIAPFAAAINGATNASQITAALNQYCLFDGCRNGTNFHLAAHFELDKLTAEVAYLETNKNVSPSSLVFAQADLNNASSTLGAVGSSAYAASQSSNIFGNLTAASKAMQQSRQAQALSKARLAAASVIAGYNKTIGSYRTAIAQLAAKGIPTAALNQTLANATSSVIVPLQNALNSSANLTQLTSAFKARCLENGCANGTNFHLDVQLKLGEAQAELNYLSLRASQSANVIVNSTALSNARGYLANASALIGSAGGAQLSNGLISRVGAYSGNFTSALKQAYTVGRSAPVGPTAVARPTAKSPNAPITVPPVTSSGGKIPAGASANGVTTTPGKNAIISPPIIVKKNATAVAPVGPASGSTPPPAPGSSVVGNVPTR
jgi:hypothetical protein